MSHIIDGQGAVKTKDSLVFGTIVAFSGTRIPTGYGLCNGTLGTPDLVDHMVLGDAAVGTGSQAGTVSPASLTHTGFALANHSAHSPTQPSAHSAHIVTQPANHSAHSPTQPATHPTHASGGTHTHDAHTLAADGSVAAAIAKLVGPATHSSDGGHAHDAHPAHAGWGVDAHSAHAGFAVDAHSAHAGFAVDAHSVHSIGQSNAHAFKLMELAYVMRL